MTLFYEARGRLYADNQLFHLAYFETEADAENHAAEHPGGFVVETSPGLIWRSTTPITAP